MLDARAGLLVGFRRFSLLVAGAAVLSLLSVQVSVAAGESSGTIVRRSGQRTILLSQEEAQEGVSLPDALVLQGTETVTIGARPLIRGEDYDIDYAAGTITFACALAGTSRVTIDYLFLPLDLREVYRHAVLESMGPAPGRTWESPAILKTATHKPARHTPPGLLVAGAKTFGVTLGSDRDLSFEQSLRLNVSGNVTRDVSVNAYLSDQNTPLTPEGDTEELRALDKVLIEIEGEGVSATLGDYELSVDGGSLARFDRELTGAMVSADLGAFGLKLAGARSAGEFGSVTARGTDGKQGPYLVTDRHGATGVSVVAGSESVWLDGERQRRGEDNDYVIDYAVGSVEFTERRHITSDSVITIDYEYTVHDFERDIYGGRATYGLPSGPAELGLSFLREVDDRGAATAGVTEEELAILGRAGDDIELAHDDGVDSVGMGHGDYVLDPEGYFVYAGPDSGDYDLYFERYEEGEYSYDYEGGFYYHVHPGEGDYRLGKRLPMPRDHALLAFDGRCALGGNVSVAADGAISSVDRNTFSELDDDDNLGNAECVSVEISDLALPGSGGSTVDVAVTGRRVSAGFEGVGRFRSATYEERWELTGLEICGEELLGEASSRLALSGGGTLELSAGALSRGGGLDSRKTEFAFDGRPSEKLHVKGSGRVVDLDALSTAGARLKRRRVLYRGDIDYTVAFLRPGASYVHDLRRSEEDQSQSGERFDEYGLALGTIGSVPVSFGVRYAHRLTDSFIESGWEPASVTRTQEYSVGLRQWEKLMLDGSVVRRSIERSRSSLEPDSRYDLADLKLTHRSLGGGIRGEARYSVTATEIEKREKRTTPGEQGTVTHIVSMGYMPVTDLSASTKWQIRLGDAWPARRGMPDPSALRRFLSSLSLESSLRLREMTTTTAKTRLYMLDPSVLRGEDTIRGELTGRHVARYVLPNGSLSLRLSLVTRNELDHVYTNVREKRTQRTGSLDAKFSRPGGITYRVGGEVGRCRRASQDGESYSLVEGSVLGEIRARRLGSFEASLIVEHTREVEELEGLEANIFGVTPSATYRLKGRGAVTASITRTIVSAPAGEIPTYMAAGRSVGGTSDWRVDGDYRLTRHLTGSLGYRGERRPGSTTRHRLDVRVNAFF